MRLPATITVRFGNAGRPVASITVTCVKTSGVGSAANPAGNGKSSALTKRSALTLRERGGFPFTVRTLYQGSGLARPGQPAIYFSNHASIPISFVRTSAFRKPAASTIFSNCCVVYARLSSMKRNVRMAERAGLHLTDMQCLNLLELLGPVTPGKLAECTGLTTGRVTVTLPQGGTSIRGELLFARERYSRGTPIRVMLRICPTVQSAALSRHSRRIV
jgi:hypothetical protein